MEIETTPPMVAKKLWNIVRIVWFMLRKSLSKSKIMLDLHFMLKQGKLAGKAITNQLIQLHHHHNSAFTSCRADTDVVHSLISTREYEFSCSNTPSYPNFHLINRRKHHHHLHNYQQHSRHYHYDDMATVNAVKKAIDQILNNGGEMKAVDQASPLVALPGFGKSPLGRQLRITDSPFPIKDEGDFTQVNMAAEEFINKFYMELKQQKKMAALELSP